MSGELISREAAIEAVKQAIYNHDSAIMRLTELPSVNPQESKWDMLLNWLNDMRFGIAPDETVTDIDELHCREAQTDILDEIMDWMKKQTPKGKCLLSQKYRDWLFIQEPKTDVLDKIRAEIKALSNANPSYWHSGDMVEREEVFEIIDKYKAESDHKCHTCKHYTSGEYDGCCDSYICEHYSGWESEDKE